MVFLKGKWAGGLNVFDTFTDDIALTLRAYATKGIRLEFLRTPLAFELEKKSFTSWIMQFSRWFIGNLKLYKLQIEAFKKADMKIKIRMFGIIYIWYILSVSITAGILSIMFFKLNIFVFLFSYLAVTVLLYGIDEVRELNTAYLIGFWFIYSLVKVCSIMLSLYTILFLYA